MYDMTTTHTLNLQIGDRIATSYYGQRVEGTISAMRGHTIRWDVRELTIQLDEPTVIGGGRPRTSMIVCDDWHGGDAEGFSHIGWKPLADGFSREQTIVKLDGCAK